MLYPDTLTAARHAACVNRVAMPPKAPKSASCQPGGMSVTNSFAVDTLQTGALGCDTRVLLQKHADWRWHSDTAWYPRARTLRQTVAGGWSDPLRRLFKASDPFATRGHSP